MFKPFKSESLATWDNITRTLSIAWAKSSAACSGNESSLTVIMQYLSGNHLMLQHCGDPFVTLYIGFSGVCMPHMCQWSHQVFDLCTFAFQLWEVARVIKWQDLQTGKLCNHSVISVELTDVCPNGMHVVFWNTIQDIEAQQVKHCTQHVHCSTQVHYMQFIWLQIMTWQIWQLKDKVKCMVQLSPLPCCEIWPIPCGIIHNITVPTIPWSLSAGKAVFTRVIGIVMC